MLKVRNLAVQQFDLCQEDGFFGLRVIDHKRVSGPKANL